MKLHSPLSLASLISVVLAHSQDPLVDLGYSIYQGLTNDTTGVASFLGIRYAAPPTGDLRFAAPQPPPNITGVQPAVYQPNACPQASYGSEPTSPYLNITGMQRRDSTTPGFSEDCLFLNVFTPVDAHKNATADLPVLVWIHGGGYISWGAYMHPGEDLAAAADNGAVVVVLQYRLGIFGFLSGNEFVQGGGALNAGLLDQRFALQWVQDHIGQFGGDSSKVTIWGQSAGGGSVFQHIVADGGNTQPPLFHRAMVSSNFMPPQYMYNDSIPEAIYQSVVQAADCATSTESLSCLRNASVDVLENVNNLTNFNALYGTFTTVPVIDGKLFSEPVTETLVKGNVNGEMLLSITNADEGAIFIDPKTANTTSYVHNLFPYLPIDEARKVGSVYANFTTPGGSGDVTPAVAQASGILGESTFTCPTYLLLDAFNKAGKQAWKGLFAVPPAHHGDDLAYYFPSSPFFNPAVNDTELVSSFAKTFLSVVINADPNTHIDSSDATPRWSTWAQGNTEMIFNVTNANETDIKVSITDPDMLSRCRIWQGLAQYTGH
ncbi:alpha beta-hydrolase [Coniophora puteana RWD-64-598 SS2]|uniref:Carboxylic ester hydrolase n=1 Tax=Coniophora puteana (strain RWD-64-598) TaxID=741705 RepID=A0A5M3MWT9_CONPW|nr:alpha beta-hydrolase [Coniophora puteana RWD-64-598 SS2]EIW83609.1 alpha beta-hydrolase [Coniophora puteana RWD-64-598 SS2]